MKTKFVSVLILVVIVIAAAMFYGKETMLTGPVTKIEGQNVYFKASGKERIARLENDTVVTNKSVMVSKLSDVLNISEIEVFFKGPANQAEFKATRVNFK